MADEGFFPHPAGRPVERRVTHACRMTIVAKVAAEDSYAIGFQEFETGHEFTVEICPLCADEIAKALAALLRERKPGSN